MNVCAVSFKECWRDPAGRWVSDGGFPLQMAAIGSLFDEMTLVIVEGETKRGGIPLPPGARVVALKRPGGADLRRKLSVLLSLPYYLSRISRHVRPADVVHVPLPGDIPLLAVLTSLVLRKRLLARYGGSWTRTSQTTFMNRVTRTLLRLSSGGDRLLLATGEGAAPPARGAEWIFVTALSRDELARISPDLGRGLATPARLVYAGRLSPEKGVATLVRAVALLKRDGFSPVPSITLVGDGPARGDLEKLATALDCRDAFVFAGQAAREELSRHLTVADFCVAPSLTEGFSKAWLDAMAHGLPVLASDVGAARAVIGQREERGWLVEPGDADALARALARVLRGPVAWPELRRRCRAYAEGRTLEAWTEKIGRLCAGRWGMTLAEGKLRA